MPEERWYRKVVGGLWDEIGQLQFDFLKDQGMKPDDFVLDVGCGPLRGGIKIIPYLNDSHYYGFDKDEKFIKAAEKEIKEAGLGRKRPQLYIDDTFNFRQTQQEFDFILAHSLFTHLNMNDILYCILRVHEVLKQDGKFFFTCFLSEGLKESLDKISHKQFTTSLTRNPYHYPLSFFKWIGKELHMTVKEIEFDHPRNQNMIQMMKYKTSGRKKK